MQVKPATSFALPWDDCAKEIQKLLEDLGRMHEQKMFPSFIKFMQFPKYRNLRPGVRVSFDFPITAIVGRNGTGKSAILTALRGAPFNTSVGNWWFGTLVDPIDDDDPIGVAPKRIPLAPSERHALWYGYESDGIEREALKTRVRREGDPDYWEPSRPVVKYGMQPLAGDERHPQIKKPVVYVNSRTQISAFDRCFYFCSPRTLKNFAGRNYWKEYVAKKPRAPKVQDFLRFRSKDLRNHYAGTRAPDARGNAKLDLSKDELRDVAAILGRTYEAGTVIEHRFYETWGRTFFFKTPHRGYTDAAAGSGEAAVVSLVHDVWQAPDGALLLLDEPEVSLHPGAQREVVRFLLRMCRKKKLQIVVSTHSPSIIEQFPPESIKVCVTAEDGLVHLETNRTAADAFFELGATPPDTKHLLVEDALAQKLLYIVAKTLSQSQQARLKIDFRPGGESAMKKSIVVHMGISSRPFFVFDGDCKRLDAPDWRDLATKKQTIAEMDKVIFGCAGQTIAFYQDSNMSEDAKVNLRRTYLDYFRERVFFLPFKNPETVLWDDGFCEQMVDVIRPKSDHTAFLAGLEGRSPKENFAEFAQQTGLEISAVHDLFLAHFRDSANDAWLQTKMLLETIVNASS